MGWYSQGKTGGYMSEYPFVGTPQSRYETYRSLRGTHTGSQWPEFSSPEEFDAWLQDPRNAATASLFRNVPTSHGIDPSTGQPYQTIPERGANPPVGDVNNPVGGANPSGGYMPEYLRQMLGWVNGQSPGFASGGFQNNPLLWMLGQHGGGVNTPVGGGGGGVNNPVSPVNTPGGGGDNGMYIGGNRSFDPRRFLLGNGFSPFPQRRLGFGGGWGGGFGGRNSMINRFRPGFGGGVNSGSGTNFTRVPGTGYYQGTNGERFYHTPLEERKPGYFYLS